MKSNKGGSHQNGGVTGYAPTSQMKVPVTAKGPARKPSAVHSDFKSPTKA